MAATPSNMMPLGTIAPEFSLLDTISGKYKTIHDDTIMITGNSNDDVVDMCVAAEINHLLEKPMRPYVLQLAVRAIASKYMKFANRPLMMAAIKN